MPRFSGVSTGAVPGNTNSLVATTLPKLQRQITDVFFEATPFFWWTREKNRTMQWSGGESMETPLLYDENPMARAYQSYEVMDVRPPQGVTTAIWSQSHYRIPLMYARSTGDANQGDAAIVNLIDTLKEQANLSLVKAINTDLFAEGTQDPVQINSMYTLVQQAAAASQTTTPGGISKATYTWWRNQYAAVTSASAGIVNAFRELHMACSNGSDKPDFAVCDEWTYMNLEVKLQTAVQYVNPDAIDFGFENVSYKGVTITFDKTIADDSHDGDGDGSLFLLNTKYLKLAIGAANFRVLAPEYDKWQDAYVGLILSDMQLICTHPARQGVLSGGAYLLAC